MWEIYTAMRPFSGMPKALLGHAILSGKRPDFPADAPKQFVDLAEARWAGEAVSR